MKQTLRPDVVSSVGLFLSQSEVQPTGISSGIGSVFCPISGFCLIAFMASKASRPKARIWASSHLWSKISRLVALAAEWMIICRKANKCNEGTAAKLDGRGFKYQLLQSPCSSIDGVSPSTLDSLEHLFNMPGPVIFLPMEERKTSHLGPLAPL